MFSDVVMTILGVAGSLLGAFLAVPQAIRSIKKGSSGVSTTSFQLLFALGLTWMLYGISQDLWLLALSDGFLALTTFIVLAVLHRDGVSIWNNTRVALFMMLLIGAVSLVDLIWLGLLAGVVSVLLRYPQMKLVRSADSISGISLSTWNVAAATNVCWCLYGALNKDVSLTVATAINVVITLALVRAVILRRNEPNSLNAAVS